LPKLGEDSTIINIINISIWNLKTVPKSNIWPKTEEIERGFATKRKIFHPNKANFLAGKRRIISSERYRSAQKQASVNKVSTCC
jgi:hypothetical protein